MSKTSESSHRQHILLFPFMAQGHLIPFLALARLLEQKTDHIITLINTPLNILALQSSLPPDSSIRLSCLPFDSSHHGLPPHAENTDSIPHHLILRLVYASETLQPSFEHLVSTICTQEGRPPLCIISDEFMSWSVETAHKFGAFHSVASTSGAYGSLIFTSVWLHLPHMRTDADEFPLPEFPGISIHRSQLPDDCRNVDESDPWCILFRKHASFFGRSDGILVNTVEELDSTALMHMRENLWRKAWAIGPLLHPPSSRKEEPIVSSLSCTEWLNLHPKSSVLYISFGSQNSINAAQMMELAKGLEACGKAFIWVIRPPIGFDVKEDFRAEWLPEGFENRMAERRQGLLVKKWAPQLEILSHESTGAFLSHCGWNSILESLSQGLPIIGWPMGAEQLFNSKLLEEELGVGVEMARGSKAEIRGVDVTRVIGLVMGGESERGMEMRRNAKRLEEVLKAAVVDEEHRKGSSVRALEDFLQTAALRKAMLQ
ncbi:UDP-glycosyltransferase 92A1-like [Magnolia sinica]|uniref:UDP-glycosyltransferase 92A1-like n=1 Tax=Magnolia sinica TaxID=86752 RepID=UPI002658CAC1|nr:UDP-glycosyltransferase 92A1-like [Magnolia sinica]